MLFLIFFVLQCILTVKSQIDEILSCENAFLCHKGQLQRLAKMVDEIINHVGDDRAAISLQSLLYDHDNELDTRDIHENAKKFLKNCEKVAEKLDGEQYVGMDLFGFPLTPNLYNGIKSYFGSLVVPFLIQNL